MCEHRPVVTLGRGARAENVLASGAKLERLGIAVHRTSRGGDVTYHGPGQLVGYPVVRLGGGVVDHMMAMAQAVAAVLTAFGVEAVWRREAPGLWVGGAKICAFGVNIHRRVATHGFALNLSTDLRAFDLIVPCGDPAARATSLAALTGKAPSPLTLAPRVATALGRELRIDFVAQDDGGDIDRRATQLQCRSESLE